MLGPVSPSKLYIMLLYESVCVFKGENIAVSIIIRPVLGVSWLLLEPKDQNKEY